ncbi:hypothetical protein B0H13DRAFT_1892623 [Mycena leptocephala]|nr:hypothetical protein B0H13DRAFT_1892623 [Mycena leptocephala]
MTGHTVSLSKTVSDSAARKETNAGFRPAGKEAAGGVASGSVTISPRAHQRTQKKSKKKNDAPLMVNIHSIQVTTYGLDSEGAIREPKCPSAAVVMKLRKQGLAVFETSEYTLQFGRDWTQRRIDNWLRGLFPQLFEFLDIRYPEDAMDTTSYHWALLAKSQCNHILSACPIKIEAVAATKHKIPTSLYKAGFDDALDRLLAGESLASEPETESASPPIRRAKRRVAATRWKTLSEVDAESSGESESGKSQSEEHEDVGKERRSKKSVVVIKQEMTDDLDLHDCDSDFEEIFPASILPQGLSCKWTASPSLQRSELERGGKRIRSRSQSCESSHDGTESAQGTPQLQPATSSFAYDPALGDTGGTSERGVNTESLKATRSAASSKQGSVSSGDEHGQHPAHDAACFQRGPRMKQENDRVSVALWDAAKVSRLGQKYEPECEDGVALHYGEVAQHLVARISGECG